MPFFTKWNFSMQVNDFAKINTNQSDLAEYKRYHLWDKYVMFIIFSQG